MELLVIEMPQLMKNRIMHNTFKNKKNNHFLGNGPYCCTDGRTTPDCCKNGGSGPYCCGNGANNPQCYRPTIVPTTSRPACPNGGNKEYKFS